MILRPNTNEYAPYYEPYLKLVPDGDILDILTLEEKETVAMLKDLTNEQAEFRYDSGKWSIKEVIGHLVDTERIMGYRLLSIARGETAPIPGFDERAYVEQALFDQMALEELLNQFSISRQSTVLLLKSLHKEAWLRRGKANGFEVTPRAIAFIIAGHERHHRQVIKERYLQADGYPSKP